MAGELAVSAVSDRLGAADARPAVSVCVPTYNGARWIAGAIESALHQDLADIEIVVCDDRSDDETVAIARGFDDPRLRVITNESRGGLARNWNRSVQASTGRYVKLLMQDDRLDADCVRRMLEVAQRNPDVGLVFSSRRLEFDDPSAPAAVDFGRRFGVLHEPLEPLAEVNDGRRLFGVMARDRFRRNFIGEPTAVLVARDAFERLGLFNTRTRQLTDLEMWLRIAYFYRVGFVDAPLATFRVHAGSESSSNLRSGASWLDRAWLIEGLAKEAEIARELGSWRGLRLRGLTYANAGKTLLLRGRRAPRKRFAEFQQYLSYMVRGRRDPLHNRLDADRPSAS